MEVSKKYQASDYWVKAQPEVSPIRKCVSNVTYMRNKLFYISNLEIKLCESHFAMFEATFETHFLIGQTSGHYSIQKKVKTRLRDPASWLPLAAEASSHNLVFTFKLSTVFCQFFICSNNIWNSLQYLMNVQL